MTRTSWSKVFMTLFRMKANCIKSRVISLASNDAPCSGLVAELAYVPFPKLIWDGTSRPIGFVGGLVAELAYAYGSGPYSERIAGSSPAQSTNELSREWDAYGSGPYSERIAGSSPAQSTNELSREWDAYGSGPYSERIAGSSSAQ